MFLQLQSWSVVPDSLLVLCRSLQMSNPESFPLLHLTLCFLFWVHIFWYASQDHSCLLDSPACQDHGNLLHYLKSHQKSETTDVWDNRNISSLSIICYKLLGLIKHYLRPTVISAGLSRGHGSEHWLHIRITWRAFKHNNSTQTPPYTN